MAFSRMTPLLHFTGRSSVSLVGDVEEEEAAADKAGIASRRQVILVLRLVRYFFSIRLWVFRLLFGFGESDRGLEGLVALRVVLVLLGAGGGGEGDRGELEGLVEVGEWMLEVGLKVGSMEFGFIGLENISQSKGWLKSKISSAPDDGDGDSEIGDGRVKDVGLASGLYELSKSLKSIASNAGELVSGLFIG